jgi:hypothetical protein
MRQHNGRIWKQADGVQTKWSGLNRSQRTAADSFLIQDDKTVDVEVEHVMHGNSGVRLNFDRLFIVTFFLDTTVWYVWPETDRYKYKGE